MYLGATSRRHFIFQVFESGRMEGKSGRRRNTLLSFAAAQLIQDEKNIIFGTPLTKSQLKRVSKTSYRILKISISKIEELHRLSEKYPEAAWKIRFRDTGELLDAIIPDAAVDRGQLGSNDPTLMEPSHKKKAMSPKRLPLSSCPSTPVKARSRFLVKPDPVVKRRRKNLDSCENPPLSGIEASGNSRKLRTARRVLRPQRTFNVDRMPATEKNTQENSCKLREQAPIRSERQDKKSSPQRMDRSNLSVTADMDAETAYSILQELSLKKKEIDSFDKYFATRGLRLHEIIGAGGFGIAMAVKNGDGVLSVLKLIPLNDEKMIHILREVQITASLSELRSRDARRASFPEYYNCAIVNDAMNDTVLSFLAGTGDSDSFMDPKLKKWLAIELEYGGISLREYARYPEGCLRLKHRGCALSILGQVIDTLAVAEEILEFEHRDCHWENILILNDDNDEDGCLCFDSEEGRVILPTFGLRVMLIDFGLARCRTAHGVEFLDVSLYFPAILQQSGSQRTLP